MRVLHLFGDWKWTGPSEPTLDLCVELRARGIDLSLACLPAPEGMSGFMADQARAHGIEPRHDFRLEETLSPFRILREAKKVGEACREFDILHAHFSQDHLIGGRGARATGRARIVRTNLTGVPLRGRFGSGYLLGKLTDGYLSYSQAALDADVGAFGMKGWRIDPALRPERFVPRDVPRSGFTVGVVARIQRHRRFDVLLQGVKQARVDDLKVHVVGRGSRMNELAIEPAARLGLRNVSFFSRFLGDEDYLDTLGGFDALLFLVPGSDGSCRAIREAMCMGKAVIGARRGMIPEIVDHEKTGLVIDDTPESIARAIERLAGDREACAAMGARGREKALALYDVRRQAEAVARIYQEVLAT